MLTLKFNITMAMNIKLKKKIVLTTFIASYYNKMLVYIIWHCSKKKNWGFRDYLQFSYENCWVRKPDGWSMEWGGDEP